MDVSTIPDNINKNPNGEMIRRLRASKNWTQVALAERANVSVRTIQTAEKGEIVSRRKLGQIAKAFDLQAEDILIQRFEALPVPPPPPPPPELASTPEHSLLTELEEGKIEGLESLVITGVGFIGGVYGYVTHGVQSAIASFILFVVVAIAMEYFGEFKAEVEHRRVKMRGLREVNLDTLNIQLGFALILGTFGGLLGFALGGWWTVYIGLISMFGAYIIGVIVGLNCRPRERSSKELCEEIVDLLNIPPTALQLDAMVDSSAEEKQKQEVLSTNQHSNTPTTKEMSVAKEETACTIDQVSD